MLNIKAFSSAALIWFFSVVSMGAQLSLFDSFTGKYDVLTDKYNDYILKIATEADVVHVECYSNDAFKITLFTLSIPAQPLIQHFKDHATTVSDETRLAFGLKKNNHVTEVYMPKNQEQPTNTTAVVMLKFKNNMLSDFVMQEFYDKWLKAERRLKIKKKDVIDLNWDFDK